jgi:hypothetical protein
VANILPVGAGMAAGVYARAEPPVIWAVERALVSHAPEPIGYEECAYIKMNRRHMRLRMTVAVFLTVGLACAQAPAQDPGLLKFEVASVKPSPPEARGGMARPEPGGLRYRGTNLPLKLYISSAYRIKADQVVGAPGWVDADRFDIEAEAEKPSSLEEFHLMTRTLLAERFHLKFHFETKEMPVYMRSWWTLAERS